MIDYSDYFYFDFAKVNIIHFYIYLVIAAIAAAYLTFKSTSKYKIELFFISFYLLTGNLNTLLIIKIPGISFFEIQPLRLVYLLLGFLLVRKFFFSKNTQNIRPKRTIPWWEIALIGYLVFLTLSVVVNLFPAKIITIVEALAFFIIFKGLGAMADKASYELIGKCIIIAAAVSSLVSIIQLSFDPYFLRIGSPRPAFGDVLRSNGLFSQEFNNSYFLIIAITWVLNTVKKEFLKIALVVLFSIGVLTSFMRMSWVILALVLVTYFVYIKRVAIEKLMVAGLTALVLLLSTSLFFYEDIMNSQVVKERLADNIDGRKGYFGLVLNNYQKKPILGFGDRNNEVYYTNMLQITNSRDRASGAEGGIHNGYLAVLFYYGIPALICFILFVILSIVYHANYIKENIYFVIPFLSGIIILVGNFTNAFPLLAYPSALYAIHIGMGIGYRKLARLSPDQKEQISKL